MSSQTACEMGRCSLHGDEILSGLEVVKRGSAVGLVSANENVSHHMARDLAPTKNTCSFFSHEAIYKQHEH